MLQQRKQISHGNNHHDLQKSSHQEVDILFCLNSAFLCCQHLFNNSPLGCLPSNIYHLNVYRKNTSHVIRTKIYMDYHRCQGFLVFKVGLELKDVLINHTVLTSLSSRNIPGQKNQGGDKT
jgi:hypothetical protein